MKKQNTFLHTGRGPAGMKPFFILWSTQALSALGSSMTSFGLIIWSYQQQGSALTTALLSVCSYAPYVLLSLFAGVLSDRWNKKTTMLICDSLAALTTLVVWLLLWSGRLEIWHLYVINAINGVMNSTQQPASEVAISALTPREQYQRVGGLRTFANSLVTVLTPMLATACLSFWGMGSLILFDAVSFLVAFLALALFIRLPGGSAGAKERESFREAAAQGLGYLRDNRGILDLILFLAAINLIASIYEAALAPMLLSRSGGGQTALGMVSAATGLANLAGSVCAALLPAPKSRVRVILNSLLFAMCSENFLLAFGKSAPVWCLGAVLGWLAIPLMNTNLDALTRSRIPLDMQGRVYAIRNALQFFTIPLGYLAGGFLVDRVFEPWMGLRPQDSLVVSVFGSGKGSGAALLYFFLAFAGIITCLIFRRDQHIRELENELRQAKR